MSTDTLIVVLGALLGALIGSFSNVLIHRLPRRESVAFPPSHCPNCQHRLSALDLIPLFSWAGLRGRCRYCGARISARYPLVELLTALGYALLAVLLPWSAAGASLLGLWAMFTLLLVISFIDAETRTIPDALVLPGLALGLLLGFANERTGALIAGLPGVQGALAGALLGAGLIALIALYGELVLRRFRERRFPEFPVSYQQVALAALVGAWLGVVWGVVLGLFSVALNVFARRVVRLPEILLLLGLLVSIVLGVSGTGPGVIDMTQNALAAAGGMSLLAALYWWTQPDEIESEDQDYDPVAMGFGDVKLMGLLGAFMGVTGALVSLGVAILVGALVGVVTLSLRRENKLPFAPLLALGALVHLLYGAQIVQAFQALYALD
nr:prepilin peptidase [Deinococcus peraridilitoris]